jgi:hypothetical protein
MSLWSDLSVTLSDSVARCYSDEPEGQNQTVQKNHPQNILSTTAAGLFPLLFNFAFGFATTEVQENQGR